MDPTVKVHLIYFIYFEPCNELNKRVGYMELIQNCLYAAIKFKIETHSCIYLESFVELLSVCVCLFVGLLFLNAFFLFLIQLKMKM